MSTRNYILFFPYSDLVSVHGLVRFMNIAGRNSLEERPDCQTWTVYQEIKASNLLQSVMPLKNNRFQPLKQANVKITEVVQYVF